MAWLGMAVNSDCGSKRRELRRAVARVDRLRSRASEPMTFSQGSDIQTSVYFRDRPGSFRDTDRSADAARNVTATRAGRRNHKPEEQG
jgi:hypothetical protein